MLLISRQLIIKRFGIFEFRNDCKIKRGGSGGKWTDLRKRERERKKERERDRKKERE